MVVERLPFRHFAERSLAGLVAVVAAGLGFGTLLLLVRYHWNPLLHLDQSVANDLNRVVSAHPPAVKVATAISHLGGSGTLISLVVLAVVALLIRRQPRLAIYLTVTGIGALILDPSLKTLVGRVRPVVADPVAHGSGNSFPSGHALGSTIVYGMLTLVFLAVVRHRWRGWFVALAALIVVLIGLSRIALGVHFVSDVLAGWLLGVAWICVTAYAFRVWRREAGLPTPSPAEGLEPEADIAPAPAESPESTVLPHPWAKGAEILVGWTLTFGLLYVLGYLLTHVIPSGPDNAVPRWLQTFRTPTFDHLSWLGSKAGDTHAILAVSLVFCPLALALWRRWRPVLFVVLTMVGEITLFLCSAAAVGRPRPPVAQLDGQMPTSSFPSGHIAATICLWTAIAIVVTGRVRQWWRWVFIGLAIVMPIVVALSRMYRGEHHPTDALGAALLAACWISVLYWTVLREGHDVEPAPRGRVEAAPDSVPRRA
ncbi:phosphatase PAP2 family protein [Actinoplanes sp. NPDC051411]|uniref:phosphatase PAP2 family protein n=1 Tax=Actinoplanes sp. NPDC051411 TaxID=3155522 RepID=UPI0034141A94